jgi:hypothetical protein
LSDQICDLIADVAGKLDFPINAVITLDFRTFLADVMELGVEMNKISPGANFRDLLPSWSHGTMSQRLRKCGHDVFEERLRIIRQDHRFVNLLCDAGTVNNVKVVHCAISNPTRLNEILPLEPYDNDNWTAADYTAFFSETVTDLERRGMSEIEICGIICDNLPAQVNGLLAFLGIENGPGAGIIHVPCLNHAANLVFAYAIRHHAFADVIQELPDRIRTLRSKKAVAIIGSHCPSLIRTRWVYIVEVLKFMLSHLPDVQSVFEIANKPPIPSHYSRVYLLLLPLWLFSHAMETRCCILGDVIPIAQEVLREWSEIKSFFGDQENVTECLNVLTAHFLARLRRNRFDVILTAFAMTLRGRAHIRLAEYGFRTRGEVSEVPELSFVSTMQHEFAQAMLAQQDQFLLPDDRLRAPPESNQELVDHGNALHPNDDDWIRDAQIPLDPDLHSFQEYLEEELGIPLEERLDRNLADGILSRIQGSIVHQCGYFNYDKEKF